FRNASIQLIVALSELAYLKDNKPASRRQTDQKIADILNDQQLLKRCHSGHCSECGCPCQNCSSFWRLRLLSSEEIEKLRNLCAQPAGSISRLEAQLQAETLRRVQKISIGLQL
uniref:ARF7EP_C domain-containing protein n=1 Tax=Macrostomum lignano TaxID=282301 RepID=A0A1I8F9P0_9PLAT